MASNCIFCKLIREKEKSNYLYKNDNLIVFNDINPQAPVHLLILPKKHIRSVNNLLDKDREIIADMIMVGKEMAVKKKINNLGYKLLLNVESGGGQVIFHLHMHLMGGWE